MKKKFLIILFFLSLFSNDVIAEKVNVFNFTAEEFTSLICWLSSEENSFSTAAVFDISGGRSTY